MEVPLIVFVALSPVFHAEVMLDPGAKMSTHGPKLEKDETVSDEVVEPTVIADGVLDGEKLQASAVLFPAATACETPACVEAVTASLTA